MEGFFESKVKEVLGVLGYIRVCALLAIGYKKGEDKKYGGRFGTESVCFAEKWGAPLPRNSAG